MDQLDLELELEPSPRTDSKKISKIDCHVLIEKMIHRIKGWNHRRISYSGRLILVKSVLIKTVHSYWAQMDRINSWCRDFLWDGTYSYNKVPLVNWGAICKEKIIVLSQRT
ncbi:hypothetical protein RND81_12G151500 [Saponaria officinalis]|uniref:Uncharacterized protein n=1 Tax=Saponaria officinalis TaxID=3572 RepID=A0AAW1HB07_SAPOF